MANLAGINLALQTPFNENGALDYDRWQALIETYLDCGVHGIVLGSGTGQHPYLTESECKQLYELGAPLIKGRAALICQTSALNMEDVIRRSQHAERLGADALMILPPYLEGPVDDDGLFEFYRAIDDSIGIDIIGYNIPQATGVMVSPELFTRLIELEHFNFMKDSAGDMTSLQAFLMIDSAKVLNGADPLTMYAFMAGVVGCIWGCANYMPKECVALYDHLSADRHQEAKALWDRMLPSLVHIWRGSDYVASVKTACRARGYDGGTVRRPVRPLSPDAEARLLGTLEPLGKP